MSEATITSKGQITIPVEVRTSMALQAGERVVFTTLDDGTVVMRAKNQSILDLKGMLASEGAAGKPVAIADMNIGQSE